MDFIIKLSFYNEESYDSRFATFLILQQERGDLVETQDSRLSGILRNRKKLPEMSSDSSYAVRFRTPRSPSVVSEPDSAEKKEIELLKLVN